MFRTNLSFDNLLSWFTKSDYNTLLFYVSGYANTEDVNSAIVRNQYDIDRLTGDRIAYIYFNKYHQKKEDSIIHITDKEINKDEISCNYTLTEDFCNYYDISRFNLPALAVISKKNLKHVELFPIGNVNELDLYLKPIGLLNAFVNEKDPIDYKIKQYNSITREINECTRKIEDNNARISFLKNHIDYCRVDTTIAERIQYEYRVLLRQVKEKGHKQNEFEDIFDSGPNYEFESIYTKLKRIGLSSENRNDIKNMVNDLNLIGTFRSFNSREGTVEVQVKKTINNNAQEIEYLQETNINFRDEINRLDKEKLNTKFIKNLKISKKNLINKCVKQLSQIIYTEISEDFLKDLLKSNMLDVVTLMRFVKDNGICINNVLREIKEKVENKHFDVFISCKSEDYDSAYSVYNLLKDNGYYPFIAPVSLRQITSDNFGCIIRNVISDCKYMIVYTSDIKYLTSSYVYSEWNQFLDEISSGYKNGKLFTIIPDNTNTRYLPSGLRTKQFFYLSNYKEELAYYLRKQ